LECLLSKHYMMLEEIHVCGSQFFLVWNFASTQHFF
jgi:hypothetical protein